VYLQPLGISSMLDVPILHEQKMVGVICHEHVGPRRTWNSDEENFAYLMSNFVALALEKKGTRPVPG
jgi:GAF domain-containing protein